VSAAIGVIEWESAPVSAKRRAELDAHPYVTVTEVTPVLATACGFFIQDQSVSLADERYLSQMLGLDAPEPPKLKKIPQVEARPDAYRRGRRGRRR